MSCTVAPQMARLQKQAQPRMLSLTTRACECYKRLAASLSRNTYASSNSLSHHPSRTPRRIYSAIAQAIRLVEVTHKQQTSHDPFSLFNSVDSSLASATRLQLMYPQVHERELNRDIDTEPSTTAIHQLKMEKTRWTAATTHYTPYPGAEPLPNAVWFCCGCKRKWLTKEMGSVCVGCSHQYAVECCELAG